MFEADTDASSPATAGPGADAWAYHAYELAGVTPSAVTLPSG